MDFPPDVCGHDDDLNQWLPDAGPYAKAFFDPVEHEDDVLVHDIGAFSQAWQLTSSSLSRQPLTDEERQLFQAYVEQWRADTLALSSTRQITSHPNYKKIIELGRKVLPLVLQELQDRPTYWFAALEELAPEGPRGPFGNFNERRQAWLTWGIQRGELRRLQPTVVSGFSKAQIRKSQTKKSFRSKL
jgi:hypothetical protein